MLLSDRDILAELDQGRVQLDPFDAGMVQPSPAPRFSRTPGAIQSNPAHAGQHTAEVLAFAGYSDGEIADLTASGAAK